MPIQIVEDGKERIVSELTAFKYLSKDIDVGHIAERLLRDERIHTMNRDGAPIQMQLVRTWHKDEPFKPQEPRQADIFATETVPTTPAARQWVADCTMHLELDVTVRCHAPDEQSACAMIEETVLGRQSPRPDLTVEVDDESLEALMFRIDQMRLPTDLGATHIAVHKVTQQALLEDQT